MPAQSRMLSSQRSQHACHVTRYTSHCGGYTARSQVEFELEDQKTDDLVSAAALLA